MVHPHIAVRSIECESKRWSFAVRKGSVNWRTPRCGCPGNIPVSLDPSVEGTLLARIDPGQPPRTCGDLKVGASLCPPNFNATRTVECRRGRTSREMRIVRLRSVQGPTRAQELGRSLILEPPRLRRAAPRGPRDGRLQ